MTSITKYAFGNEVIISLLFCYTQDRANVILIIFPKDPLHQKLCPHPCCICVPIHKRKLVKPEQARTGECPPSYATRLILVRSRIHTTGRSYNCPGSTRKVLVRGLRCTTLAQSVARPPGSAVSIVQRESTEDTFF